MGDLFVKYLMTNAVSELSHPDKRLAELLSVNEMLIREKTPVSYGYRVEDWPLHSLYPSP